MRVRRVFLLVLVLMLALTTASCGLRKKAREKASEVAQGAVEKVVEKAVTQVAKGETQEAKEETQATEPPPTPKPRKLPTPTPEETPAAESTEGGGELADILSTENLDSCRLHVLLRTVTEEETLTLEHEMAFVREPLASHILTTVTDKDGKQTTTEAIQIGETVYVRPGGEEWMATSGTSDIARPEDILAVGQGYYFGELADCKDLGVETVSGLKTRHYRCDESSEQWKGAIFVPGFLEGRMDAWVSSEYNAAIKAISTYKAKDQEGKTAEIHMEFEYADINQPIEIVAPEGVQVGLPEDVPLIEGAEELTIMGPIVSFQVAKSAKEVSDYYIAAMKDNGWSYKSDESMPPMIHGFAKGERQMNLMLNEEDGKTSVTIMLGEPEG